MTDAMVKLSIEQYETLSRAMVMIANGRSADGKPLYRRDVEALARQACLSVGWAWDKHSVRSAAE